MKHTFPKWFYHQNLMPEGQIIYSEEQFKTLGPGWVESPAMFDVKVESEKAPSLEKAQPKATEKQAEKAQKPQASEEKAPTATTDSADNGSNQTQVIPILKRKRKGEA